MCRRSYEVKIKKLAFWFAADLPALWVSRSHDTGQMTPSVTMWKTSCIQIVSLSSVGRQKMEGSVGAAMDTACVVSKEEDEGEEEVLFTGITFEPKAWLNPAS